MTIEVTDLTKIKVAPGDGLLIRFPRHTSADEFRHMRSAIDHLLEKHGLDWPLIFASEDVDFEVINGSTLDLIAKAVEKRLTEKGRFKT